MRVHEHVVARGDTDATDMWTDTHGLLAVNPRTWHMGSLALDVWDVAKRGNPAPLSHIGKLVRCLDEDVESSTGDDCNSPWAVLGRTECATL